MTYGLAEQQALVEENRRMREEFYKRVDLYLLVNWERGPMLKYVVPWCVKKGVSANPMTFLTLVMGILAAWLIWSGQPVIGVLLFYAARMLDWTDGAIARETDTVTRWGRWFDWGTGGLTVGLVFLAIGGWWMWWGAVLMPLANCYLLYRFDLGEETPFMDKHPVVKGLWYDTGGILPYSTLIPAALLGGLMEWSAISVATGSCYLVWLVWKGSR
jgi:hypothetical protein